MKIEDGTAGEGKWQTECNGGGSPRRLSSLKSSPAFGDESWKFGLVSCGV